MKKEQNPLIKMAIRAHTDAVLSGKYPTLHMTPESETAFCIGYLAGMDYAVDTWEDNLKQIQNQIQQAPQIEQAPTLLRNPQNLN
jgi:hypothetical protein